MNEKAFLKYLTEMGHPEHSQSQIRASRLLPCSSYKCCDEHGGVPLSTVVFSGYIPSGGIVESYGSSILSF